MAAREGVESVNFGALIFATRPLSVPFLFGISHLREAVNKNGYLMIRRTIRGCEKLGLFPPRNMIL